MQEQKTKQDKLIPGGEVEQIVMEATQQVEDELRLEDEGWINLSAAGADIITALERISNLKLSRLYYYKDPLAKQAIRLWTDYSFGPGMTSHAEDEQTEAVRKSFWDLPANKSVLSARGQRKSSDKLLVDGEVFFAIFLGASGDPATIRRIDPLEIAEIITNPDDIEDVRFYHRSWTDPQSQSHDTFYRSTTNIEGVVTQNAQGSSIIHNDEALVYHLAYNTIGQRGNPLLLPALDWIKQYRRFLASRIAVMLALARFAWKTKVKGGQATVDAIKAKTDGKEIAAGSQMLENLGSDTTPIKTESGAAAAKDDARMIKLQVCSAVGWPEQYFGDIATGNLATAKTVELPVTKMCQSYQSVWDDAYLDIDEIVYAHNKIPPNKWYTDRNFPTIAPENYSEMAASIQQILQVIPEFTESPEVLMQALVSIGVNDPGEVLDTLAKEAKGNPERALTKALKQFREALANNGHKKE